MYIDREFLHTVLPFFCEQMFLSQNESEIILFYRILYIDKGYVNWHYNMNIYYPYERYQRWLKEPR